MRPELTPSDFTIPSLGEVVLDSPLGLSTVFGDDIANYVDDTESALMETDKARLLETVSSGSFVAAFQKAGPRKKIYFDAAKTTAAIVTCGGLCPGINNVIRTIVMQLYHRYGLRRILGVKYGYRGFIPRYGVEPVELKPDDVKEIHNVGGSILCSSRGEQDIGDVVDSLVAWKVDILFAIGGDGTIRGAQEIYAEIARRKLPISVIGVPKTIDNDIAFVEKTFGLETAFSVAAEAIRSAHTEAIGAPFGIGLVKVMGRMSGFIAANAALALNEVNFVLVPEQKFELLGPKGLLTLLEQRLRKRGHAVIIVAEGAGQELLAGDSTLKDASGNAILQDIGLYLKDAIKKYFAPIKDLDVNLKYIDPSYLVRSVPANGHDAIYCIQLAQNAVHAAMAGKTGMLVGDWNGQFTHVPLALAVSERKQLSLESTLWLTVLRIDWPAFEFFERQSLNTGLGLFSSRPANGPMEFSGGRL